MISALIKLRERDWLLGIFLVGLVARVIAAIILPDQTALLPDSVSFRDNAAKFLAEGRISNPFEMPLYPLLIAIFGRGQVAADIVLSVATIWIVYALARELFNDRLTAILAALAAACYPPLIFFSVVGLSETLFIAMMLSAFLFWYRGRFTIASIFAVLAILTRPVFEVAPFLLAYFALIIHSPIASRNCATPGGLCRHLLCAVNAVVVKQLCGIRAFRASYRRFWLSALCR